MDEHLNLYKKDYDKIISKISTDYLYTFSSPRRQFYSLPSAIIYQIFNQKKSPHFLLKLLQTCKYFFHKRQILPIVSQSTPAECFGNDVNGHKGESLHFNYSKKVLFWFDDSLSCRQISSSVKEKIYCCTSLKSLSIHHCIIPQNLFEIFFADALKIEHFAFHFSSFVYPDGSNIPLNIILEKIPNCDKLVYWNAKEKFSKQTLLKLNEIKRSKELKVSSFRLYIVADDFDLNLFCKFIIKNHFSDSACFIVLIIGKCQLAVNDFERCFDSLLIDWKEKRPKIKISSDKMYLDEDFSWKNSEC